jgi:hypothetical protein
VKINYREYVPVTLKVTGTMAMIDTWKRGAGNPKPNPLTIQKI